MRTERPYTARDLEAMAGMFRKSAALLAACELNLFTALSGAARTPQDAARSVNADPRAVDRLLRALAVLGLVEETGGRFRNTPLSERHLVQGAPEYIGGLGHQANVYRSWGDLAQAARRGGSMPRGPENPEAVRRFIAAMHHRAQVQAPGLAAALGLAGVRRMLDVGGGSAAFAMAFCLARPELSAVVLDLPHVLDLTREYLAAEDMEHRVELQPGDYLEADFGAEFDLVFFSAIMHINSPLQNRRLLSKAFAALNPGGRVAVSDFVMDDDRMGPEQGVFFALNMLANTREGDTYTESEYRQWMTEAGFTEFTRAATGPATALLAARKPA